jgi:general secretion pathway protein H
MVMVRQSPSPSIRLLRPKCALVPRGEREAKPLPFDEGAFVESIRHPSQLAAPKKTPAGIAGFTLVEIMVVVVIVGIALSIAVSNLFIGDEQRVRLEAERMLVLVEKTRDQAVFSGYPIAMRVTGEGIEFLERDPNSVEPTWRNAVAGSLRSRTWRDGIRVELAEINSGSNTNSNLARNAATTSGGRSVPREQIVTFLPTGIGVPFSMRIFSDQFQRVIDGDALGNVAFRQ